MRGPAISAAVIGTLLLFTLFAAWWNSRSVPPAKHVGRCHNGSATNETFAQQARGHNNSDAFVTYAYGNITDARVSLIRFWKYQLRDVPNVDYVLLVQPQQKDAWTKALLAVPDLHIVGIDAKPPVHCTDTRSPDKYGTDAYFAGSYLALGAFSLTEYVRLAVVDTDVTVVNASVFHLLGNDTATRVAGTLDYPPFDCPGNGYTQMGIFLARPDAHFLDDYDEFVATSKPRCGLAVQDSLNGYLRHKDANRLLLCLPKTFNCRISHAPDSSASSVPCTSRGVYFIHFAGAVKPLSMTRDDIASIPADRSDLKEAIYNYRDAFGRWENSTARARRYF